MADIDAMLFADDQQDSVPGDPVAPPAAATASRPGVGSQTAASEASFPTRVSALLRSRPITDAVTAATRQDWPEDTYDIATLALAAIEVVISRQGFDAEATWEDVVGELTTLARRAAPDRERSEHERVAAFTVDALLNRAEREAEFTYRFGDYTNQDTGFQQRQVSFRLLEEREDPLSGDVVLHATSDAINALVSGLDYDVEDAQVANEVMLERQLARGAFGAAEANAEAMRALSLQYTRELTDVIKDTRRDLRAVSHRWHEDVPARLAEAREHIKGRLDAEHRLLLKVRESLESDDSEVALVSARIATRLNECQQRHEALHGQVIRARSVFLEEQDRQAFRPPALAYRPDLNREVLGPLLVLDVETASIVGERFLTDVSGPVIRRLPRLYQLINDLWTVRERNDDSDEPVLAEEIGDPDPVTIAPETVEAARRAVTTTGLPARLSALIAAAMTDEASDPQVRSSAARIVALATLWRYAPEDVEVDQARAADLASTVLGERSAADSDGTALALPGWAGHDLIVTPTVDALQTADPAPVTTFDNGEE
jgi:hypothetical protein